MRLPADFVVAREKLTQYLLIPQARADKSRFLAKAGFRFENSIQLADALRMLAASAEAEPLQRNQFGQYFAVRGQLTGPNGSLLPVKTIWMTEAETSVTKFITLIPDHS